MARRAPLPAALVSALLLALAAGGCGQKIAIPEPEGVFGLQTYSVFLTLDEDDPRALLQVEGALFVVAGDDLVKRNIYFEELGRAAGLADPRALCWDPEQRLIYVWEGGTRTVRMFTTELEEAGSAPLGAPAGVVAMAVSPRGAGAVAGAESFLYLSDPAGGVIHRYALDGLGGATPYGLLARDGGNSLRDVHEPAGLARDAEDHILVCDTDSLRNWVIRFDPTPDEDDEDRRGVAAIYADFEQCSPPAADEYVLGNAPGCEGEWEPGPSDSTGFFDAPREVAVAGAGRVYVADTGNDRLQIFGRGEDGTGPFGHMTSYGDPQVMPRPGALAVYDFRFGGAADAWYYGALIFAVLPEGGQLRSYISQPYDDWLNQQPRPPE